MKSKSLFTSILFYLTAGMLLISVYDSINYGFTHSYTFYMLTLVFFLSYCYRKIGEPAQEEDPESEDKNPTKAKDIYRTGGKKRTK